MTKFFKYQGTGNDFILIDDRQGEVNMNESEIAHLCHRRFGIGADGLILLRNEAGYDFSMKYYNADGKEGSMCGNGGRCIVKFAHDLDIFDKLTKFLAVDGEHMGSVIGEEVSLGMVNVTRTEILDGEYYVNTGSPHAVLFTQDLENHPVYQNGKDIRNAAFWSTRGGVNVNFVELLSDNKLFVRTYERGVEDETYSCGTGVTAAAMVAFEQKKIPSPVCIVTKGGDLEVAFEHHSDGSFTAVYLKGKAKRVFEGYF